MAPFITKIWVRLTGSIRWPGTERMTAVITMPPIPHKATGHGQARDPEIISGILTMPNIFPGTSTTSQESWLYGFLKKERGMESYN
jgi:hypothetical protein